MERLGWSDASNGATRMGFRVALQGCPVPRVDWARRDRTGARLPGPSESAPRQAELCPNKI